MSRSLYPLASLSQIRQTPSRADGIPASLESAILANACKLIHTAGILLHQKQVAVATAQILFHRFWFVSSLKSFSVADIAFGALYLGSKLEECPLRVRDLVNVYHVLLQRAKGKVGTEIGIMSYFGNTFYELKDALVVAEMQILKRLGFNTHVVLPYGSLVSYLRLLGQDRPNVVAKAWGYLNDALQSPVYALYQVPTIVSAAILLTSRFLAIRLPDAWWKLFDAEWEDVWSVCGYIMRLYHPEIDKKVVERMLTKGDVRTWLEENPRAVDVAQEENAIHN
ncbi:cyclin-like protein [Guyanagaster necrorhizus]|uniref:Cyclin-like protein n=1 Tax=Guyanagaster necrorhizus TaxID=856835 RepID=A0A9P8AYN7_9AGAR|nr:cyclin-like protein [Guyanagaster necrorhizus MCA 3950]KAG7452838.1 cyclin-like protein [Guyanagaster necrorhizus MCA 3950]